MDQAKGKDWLSTPLQFNEPLSSDPENCETSFFRYSFSNCQYEAVLEVNMHKSIFHLSQTQAILEECGCYPSFMLLLATDALKDHYQETRHANAESCRGYEITCYKKILGRMSNYTTVRASTDLELFYPADFISGG